MARRRINVVLTLADADVAGARRLEVEKRPLSGSGCRDGRSEPPGDRTEAGWDRPQITIDRQLPEVTDVDRR
jgi:hypothetical protein